MAGSPGGDRPRDRVRHLPHRATVAGRLHVPIGYSAVRWWGNVPSPCVVHAVRRANSSDELLHVDISIADTEGRVAMCIDGLQLRPVADDAVLGVVDEAPAAAAAPARLLDVIEPLGLRADEATTWLDRAVASDLDRIVVTSVDLSSLAAFTSPAVPDRPEQPQQHSIGLGLEASLAAIWQELLGVDEVAYDDDFFTLGGHSLIAIRMMTRIKNEFGVRFDLSTMFEASTVAALAERLRAERPGIDDGALRCIGRTPRRRRRRRRRSEVGAASASGDDQLPRGWASPLRRARRRRERALPVEPRESTRRGTPTARVPGDGCRSRRDPRRLDRGDGGALHRRAPRTRTGPYLLGGYSGGGIVALEMARQLRAAGEQVDHVILFDSVPPGRGIHGGAPGGLASPFAPAGQVRDRSRRT